MITEQNSNFEKSTVENSNNFRIIMLIFCLKLDKKKEKKEEKVCDMPPSKPNHYLSIKNI